MYLQPFHNEVKRIQLKGFVCSRKLSYCYVCFSVVLCYTVTLFWYSYKAHENIDVVHYLTLHNKAELTSVTI